MPKVYFRASSGKAVNKQIDWEVNYEQALEYVSKALKLPKQNIKFVYNGQPRSTNFKLNPEIPHHIVHVKDTSKIAKEELTINLLIDNGSSRKEFKNVSVKSNTQVKDLINNLVETNKLPKGQGSLNTSDIFHHGRKLNQTDTLLDVDMEDNGTVNIQLKDGQWPGMDDGFPNPANINECANILKDSLDEVFLDAAQDPKFAAIAMDLMALKDGGVILGFQQEYQKQRVEVVFSPYAPYLLKPASLW